MPEPENVLLFLLKTWTDYQLSITFLSIHKSFNRICTRVQALKQLDHLRIRKNNLTYRYSTKLLTDLTNYYINCFRKKSNRVIKQEQRANTVTQTCRFILTPAHLIFLNLHSVASLLLGTRGSNWCLQSCSCLCRNIITVTKRGFTAGLPHRTALVWVRNKQPSAFLFACYVHVCEALCTVWIHVFHPHDNV